jgi:hypothetical protein
MTENELPKLIPPITEIPEPKRKKLRSEIELPNVNMSRTDNELPKRTAPKTDRAEPTREHERSERDAPM